MFNGDYLHQMNFFPLHPHHKKIFSIMPHHSSTSAIILGTGIFSHFVKLSLSMSQSLNLSLFLRDRDRDRADTIVTLTLHPPIHSSKHKKLFKCLIGDLYSSVIHHWNRQLNLYSFPLSKNRVN